VAEGIAQEDVVARLLGRAADWRHFGRLAGFTNRKRAYRNAETGLHPFVKLIEASGTMYPKQNGLGNGRAGSKPNSTHESSSAASFSHMRHRIRRS
jgi:hypothetical protein